MFFFFSKIAKPYLIRVFPQHLKKNLTHTKHSKLEHSIKTSNPTLQKVKFTVFLNFFLFPWNNRTGMRKPPKDEEAEKQHERDEMNQLLR